MKHSVRRNGIHLLIAPAVGIDGTGEVGLLVQDVVPLKHDGELLASQEAMTQLGIPDKLVGIESLVAVASLTEHVSIGREIAPPREGDTSVSAILEVPSREVVRGL